MFTDINPVDAAALGFDVLGGVFGNDGPGLDELYNRQYVQTRRLERPKEKIAYYFNKRASERDWVKFQEMIRQWNRAQHFTIRDRVRDAKKAGLHPLYALGAASQGTGSAPTFIPGQSPTGSHAGVAQDVLDDSAGAAMRGIAKGLRSMQSNKRQQRLDKFDEEMHEAQISRMKSQERLDEAHAQYYNSLRKNAEQGTRGSGPEIISTGSVHPDGATIGTAPDGKTPSTRVIVGPDGGSHKARGAPTQVIEDEYGDVVGWVYGGYKFGVDVAKAISEAHGKLAPERRWQLEKWKKRANKAPQSFKGWAPTP
jgi:hypothetical protein